MSRKTISVDEPVFDRLDEQRRGDESWTEFCDRVTDVLEGETEGRDDERRSDALTEAHIDDIAGEAAARVVRELQSRTARTNTR